MQLWFTNSVAMFWSRHKHQPHATYFWSLNYAYWPTAMTVITCKHFQNTPHGQAPWSCQALVLPLTWRGKQYDKYSLERSNSFGSCVCVSLDYVYVVVKSTSIVRYPRISVRIHKLFSLTTEAKTNIKESLVLLCCTSWFMVQ